MEGRGFRREVYAGDELLRTNVPTLMVMGERDMRHQVHLGPAGDDVRLACAIPPAEPRIRPAREAAERTERDERAGRTARAGVRGEPSRLDAIEAEQVARAWPDVGDALDGPSPNTGTVATTPAVNMPLSGKTRKPDRPPPMSTRVSPGGDCSAGATAPAG